MPQSPRRATSATSDKFSERVVGELVPELDEHLAALSVLFHQYLKHAWLGRLEGKPFFELMLGHRGEVIRDLDAVAGHVLALGGTPLSSPAEHLNYSYLEHEGEQIYTLETMLENDHNLEEAVAFRLGITAEAAAELEALSTQRVLTGVLAAARERSRRLRQFGARTVKDWART